MTDNPEVLEMKFDPNTIQHLGVQMYYTLPPVIAEVIANSYDADAENVTVYLNDKADKEIMIEDNGNGMSFPELNSKFLRIGRNCREESSVSPGKQRPLIGKKGLGKLSFFGIRKGLIITLKCVPCVRRNSTLKLFRRRDTLRCQITD